MKAIHNYLLPLAVLLLSGCISQPEQLPQASYGPAELLPATAPFYQAGDTRVLPDVELLALDEDMRAFIDTLMAEGGSADSRLQRLLAAVVDDGPLYLEYDSVKTLTATQAFHAREGNCLTFTNMFIALAREAGLNAWYQEVEVPHNWDRVGQTWLYNRHINVLVGTGRVGQQAVDFNFGDVRDDYPRKRISDSKAQAQYHNNMGVYWMQEQRLDLAYLNLQRAVNLDPDAAYFWTNLGVLYRRAGDDSRAEAAWLQALEVGNEPTALSNLARHYSRTDQSLIAEYYQHRAEIYRRRNPYYLYSLAERAYEEGDYDRSQKLLHRALRIRDDELEFHSLLALSYSKQGDFAAAADSMAAAQRLVVAPEEQQHYSHKFRLLAGMAEN